MARDPKGFPMSDANLPSEPLTGQRYRHKQRGGKYEVLGKARLQTSRPVTDNQELVVYKGQDGNFWVRPIGEFCDGRFERVRD